jgi:RNase P subunit RPR2
MRLNLDQQRVFDDWIRQKIEHHMCQLCQSPHWRIGELISSSDHNDPGEQSSSPMVQLICQNCGHVVLFDASRIKGLHAVETNADLM